MRSAEILSVSTRYSGLFLNVDFLLEDVLVKTEGN